MTEQHRINRVNWCQKMKDFDFRNTVFTDESYVQLNRNTIKLWSKRNPVKMKPKHGPTVMLWGGVSYRDVTTLEICRGSINSERYYNFLNEHLFSTMNTFYPDGWSMIQDNCKVHTSKFTKDFLQTNHVNILPWPAPI